MGDEAFHEIQLNGKQLVFLFMAATVVAVVIFLCGVMVGRGVRTDRAGEVADLAVEAATDPTAPVESSPDGTVRPSIGSARPPSAGDEDLSYPERLAEPSLPPETLPESSGTETPAARPRASGATGPSDGDGFTVQVAAVKERSEANTIAGRLTAKGYAAYVMPPAAGAPQVFRVRVGRYRDRRDAETIAARLEREEQFKPWITR
jgi:cell division septation protein DedD